MAEKVLDHKTIEVNLGTIADAEADEALKALHSSEWDIIRERIYKAMQAAIKWNDKFGYHKRVPTCPCTPLGGSTEDEELHDDNVVLEVAYQ